VTTDDQTPVSEQGLAELQAELDRLVNVERPRIVQEIKTAREWGDLKENSEYHEAKRAQGHLETKIARLTERLRRSVVVDAPSGTGVVVFGSTVEVRDEGTGREATYQIVGPTEAKAAEGRISFESPVAKGLLGAKPGDSVTVILPSGSRQLTVVGIG
jgi:transcription elongation factor GreA